MATLMFATLTFCLICTANTQVAQITLTVKVGQYVSMPCHSRITTPVDWFYKPSDTGADQQVCIKGEVVGTFRGKVWVDTSMSTYFNLIINSTRESDAGIYTCIEDAGLGPGTFVTRLVVIADDAVRHPAITSQLVNITTETSWSTTRRADTMNPSASGSSDLKTDMTLTAGMTALLACQTAIETPADWIFKASENAPEQQVCIRGEIVNAFKGRATLDTSKRGYFNLIIKNITLKDVGIYRCIEDAGLGSNTFTIMLNVTVDQPGVVSTPTSSVGTNATGEVSGIPKAAIVAVIVTVSGVFVITVVIIIIIVYHKTSGNKSKNQHKINEQLPMLEGVNQQQSTASPQKLVEKEPTSDSQEQSSSKPPIDAALPHGTSSTNSLPPPGSVPAKSQENFLQKALKIFSSDSPKEPVVEEQPLKILYHSQLGSAQTNIELRQKRMMETRSMFSHASLPTELHETILCKAMKMFAKTMHSSSAYREIKSLISLAKVTKHWCRIIASCDAEARPELVSTLLQKNEVIAAMYLDNKIFVVSKLSKTINVYSSTDHSQLEPITLDDLKEPVDAVSWAENKSVIVADHEGGCLWTISLNGKTKKWPQLTSSIFPCTLSVARGNLVVATQDHRLLTLDASGKQLRCIEFNSNANPFHVVMTPSNKLAVCIHEKLNRRPQMPPNTENDISTIVFYSSFYLTFDGQGRGFLADCRKACIFQLTVGEMRRHRLLLSPFKDVMEEPKKLCYIDATDELLVCDKNKVKVYKVTHSRTWDLPLLNDLDMSDLSKSAK